MQSSDKTEHYICYSILDNGRLPYYVFDYPQSKKVKIALDQRIDDTEYSSFEIPYIRIFPGIDGSDVNYTGNTVLLEIGHKTYYCLQGRGSFIFKTDDIIERYYSTIGRDDVPFPFAVGSDNIYLMIEDGMTSRDFFPKRCPEQCFSASLIEEDEEEIVEEQWNPYMLFYKLVANDIPWKPFHARYRERLEKERKELEELDECKAQLAEVQLKLGHLETMYGGVKYEEAMKDFEILKTQLGDEKHL